MSDFISKLRRALYPPTRPAASLQPGHVASNLDLLNYPLLADYFNVNLEILAEAIVHEFPPEEHGGVITFSTEVNATIEPGSNLLARLGRQVAATLKSRHQGWTAYGRSKRAIQQAGGIGFNFARSRGHYRDPSTGAAFDESSISIDITGINTQQLQDLARSLCRQFDQQSVLIYDRTTGRRFLFDAN